MTFWIGRRLVEVRRERGGYVAGLLNGGDFYPIDAAAPTVLDAVVAAAVTFAEDDAVPAAARS